MGSDTDLECDKSKIEVQKNASINLKIDCLKRHKCPFENCHSAFNRPWKLERHINTHTGNRPFKCDFPLCTKDYTNKSHLLRHQTITHAQNKASSVLIYCPYPDCMKTFSNKWSLKKHCNIHKSTQLYTCEICNHTFKKYRQFKIHMSVHSGTKLFKCNSCSENFSNARELKKHERKHKIYKCEIDDCNQQFNIYNALRAHVKKNHPNWLKCDFCGHKYLNKWSLTEHVLSHLPESSREVLVCPFKDCDRHYYHQRNLDHHIKSYHNNITYECLVCKKSYTSKTTLKKHQRLHTESERKETTNSSKLKVRKSRKDKGLPQKSKAALLSGILLPKRVDKNLAQNNLTSEEVNFIENIKETSVRQDFL